MECVIVSYHSGPDLHGFAAELAADAFDRVLVVDNASGDGSDEVARSHGFDVVRRPRNDGFGMAANEGIAQTTGELVVLLNPDVHIRDASVIRRLAEQFDAPDVALCAPGLVLPDGRLQDSARSVPTPAQLVQRRRTGRDLGALRPTQASNVPWVVGAFMMIRRSAFVRVGGFDEGYFLYFEDVDLCVRLRAAGWRVRYDPTVRAAHQHGAASRAGLAQWSTRQHMRSAARFYARHPRLALGQAGAVDLAGLSVGPVTAPSAPDRAAGDTAPPRIALVVSFLNEAAYLPRLLASLDAQTEPADEVLLIDDGSEDPSPEIAGEFAAKRPAVSFLRRPRRPREVDRLVEAPELRSFAWGVEQLEPAWDVVAKLDADLVLPPTLLAEIRARFAADARLGITGSFLSLEDAAGALVRAPIPAYHVQGGTKFYRRECFCDVYPLPAILGWDTIDELRARHRGWRTESFQATTGDTIHLRPSGLHDGRLRGFTRWGRCAWAYGAHPAVVLAGTLRRMPKAPRGVGGLAYLGGWLFAAARGEPRAEPELVAYVRAEDRQRLRAEVRSALRRARAGARATTSA